MILHGEFFILGRIVWNDRMILHGEFFILGRLVFCTLYSKRTVASFVSRKLGIL